jgi:uncharacterized Zn finger protein
MECAELEKLREQVREIRKEISARRERVRSMSEQRPLAARKDGYQALLERKLGRAVADIEQHVARHQCQE